jgi:hypothetical protein
MKFKESYTLEELCTGLSITLKKFCQMAGITEGTLINLRQGHAGRSSTINSILNTFSKVYGLDFTLENVEGLTVQDKPHQKGKKPSASTTSIDAIPQTEVPQNRATIAKEEKRAYNRKEKDTGLPAGAMLAIDFARNHGIKRETFRDHMIIGLGEGTVPGEQTDPTMNVKDHVDYSERQKPGRPKEKERYLTAVQQKAALEFWQRHNVVFTQCENTTCWCHTFLEETE